MKLFMCLIVPEGKWSNLMIIFIVVTVQYTMYDLMHSVSTNSNTDECTCLADVVKEIRLKNNIEIPKTDEDYDRMKHKFLYIDVRRDYFIADAMRECRKSKFKPEKIIKVSVKKLTNSGHALYMHVH